jgi:WD40 repeat protein
VHLLSLSGGAPIELPHPGDHEIWATAYSPDGRRFASSGRDASARVFDADTGALLATLAGHAAQINALAFSADGRSLATASDDRTVKVWSVEGGPARLTYAGHGVLLYALAWSPDGKVIASGGAGRAVHLWDARTGERLAVFADHASAITKMRFSPDGARLLTVDALGDVRLWRDGRARSCVAGDDSRDHGRFADFSPGGGLVATVLGDGAVRVFDTASGAARAVFVTSSPFLGAALSPDGAFLVTGCDARALCLWDLERGTRSVALHGLPDAPRWVSFSPDSQRVLAAGRAAEILAWPVGRERRPASELAAWLAGRVPWTVVEGRLMERPR